MASTKGYRDYVLEQLGTAGFSDVRCRPMMGEYLLYIDGVLVGGIYDDRLLLKKVEGSEEFGVEEVLPYDGVVKKMWLVGEVDDRERLRGIIETIIEGLAR